MSRRTGAAALAILLAVMLAGCTGGHHTAETAPSSGSAARPGTASTAPSAPSASDRLQHVVVIVDENKPATSVVGNSAAPYLNSLAHAYALARQYSAITHPSLPNYLALTSGTTAGITSDCNPPGGSCLVTGPNIAQAIDHAGLTWKMYAESMPAPCTTANTSLYAVKHNPFLYFPSVTGDARYCSSHDVPYTQFAADLASEATLPTYSFISPNLCNDMHDCSIATGDAWLAAAVPRILASPAFTKQRSLLIVTFDEGDASDNVIPCIFAGPAARPHAVSTSAFTHYSLLRTIEDQLGLAPLTGQDAAAPPMTALLR
ncbi:alkaline phosphatase family protein [Rathayibacter sp. KR2-224]|uniref:alkaline phosphatase family protein n=1 Tax=Rathayibacter sp. KR2-224 TaxID=3400913 RepID=UPI003C036271